MGKSSYTGGVKPMNLGGRLIRERERLVGMTDEERAYRKQFLKDQILSHSEPRPVPELYKELNNPIRRFYKWPLNTLGSMLSPIVGPTRAQNIRFYTGKIFMLIGITYLGTYYFKYNQNDWTRKGGWRVITSNPAVVEGDPGYPRLSDKTKPSDYADRGFNNVNLEL